MLLSYFIKIYTIKFCDYVYCVSFLFNKYVSVVLWIVRNVFFAKFNGVFYFESFEKYVIISLKS